TRNRCAHAERREPRELSARRALRQSTAAAAGLLLDRGRIFAAAVVPALVVGLGLVVAALVVGLGFGLVVAALVALLLFLGLFLGLLLFLLLARETNVAAIDDLVLSVEAGGRGRADDLPVARVAH